MFAVLRTAAPCSASLGAMRTAAAVVLALAVSLPANALAEPLSSPTRRPLPPAASESQTEMSSVGMFVTGTALLGVGTAGIVTGAIFFHGDNCVPQGPCGNGVDEAIGAVLLGVGALHLVPGVPLLILGAWPVPVDERRRR